MILVTGGTGILGSRLLFDLVNKGEEVRAISRTMNFSILEKTFKTAAPDHHESLLKKIHWVEADVTDLVSLEDAMEGITKIFHCAGYVSFHRSDYKAMMKINMEGTENVVNLCLEKEIEKLVHVSSIAAIGRSKLDEIITEESHWKTSAENTGYAISKYVAEREVWRGIAEGLNAVIVNPGVILAPGNWQENTPAMFNTVWKGLKFYTSGGNAFVDAKDVSKAMLALMDSTIQSERYILISENMSFKEFFETIAINLNKPKATIKAGKLLASIGWRLMALISIFNDSKPLITKETAHAAQSKYSYSNAKIKVAIGMEFITIQQSVEDICKVFLREKNN